MVTVAVAVPRRVGLVPVFALAAGTALLVAVRAPLATTVLGLIGFGVLHNVLELRYVAGRFAGVLRGRFLVLLLGLVSGIVLCRLTGARIPEILLAYGVLAAGVVHAVRPAGWRLAALLGLGAALTTSLTWPAYHFVVLAHLHNVVPLVFPWGPAALRTGRGAGLRPAGSVAVRLAPVGAGDRARRHARGAVRRRLPPGPPAVRLRRQLPRLPGVSGAARAAVRCYQEATTGMISRPMVSSGVMS